MNGVAVTGCAELCHWLIDRVHTLLIHTHLGMWAAGVSGRVAVNGVAVTGAAMGRFAGYVLQDDVLPGSSTVQEYLRWVRCSVTECCSQLCLQL